MFKRLPLLHALDVNVDLAAAGKTNGPGLIVADAEMEVAHFAVGPEDAMVIAQQMQPVFGVLDLLNLPNHHFYVKLMIDGVPSRAFSGRIFNLSRVPIL